MRPLFVRFCVLALILFILVAGAIPATLSSPQYVPMPPGDFELYKSDHFDIYYDSTRISEVNTVILDANAAYETVTAFFGPFEYRGRIILASSHDQYANILYNYLTNENISESNVASGWGDGERGTIVIESPDQLPNFRTVLTHEFAHIVMRTKLIDNKYNMPEWFSEGLAIYVSGDISEGAKVLVEDACRDGKMMTIEHMEYIHGLSTDPNTSASEVTMAYAQSGMLMKYIIDKYGETYIKLVMQDFGPSGNLEQAFMNRLGYSPESLNAEWQSALKSELGARDRLLTSQSVRGFMYEPGGEPVSGQAIVFTCLRNDTTVLGKAYTATTDSAGFFSLNLTYGNFSVHVDRTGFKDVDDEITLQKYEGRLYNVTLEALGATTQDVIKAPGLPEINVTYIALGIVNVLAIILVGFVFWRVRK